MNFYNPFKPHIVRDTDGTYMVRKILFPHVAVYLEESAKHSKEPVSGFYWWSLEEFVNKYCKYNSLEVASALLNAYKEAAKTKRTLTYVPIK